ncbi:hypothetical protein SAMD00019534_084820 [Acytostelium subglobosum LB1]|uniref:hypothetical protein n=1 Tax=Acytostelium subglobosum LB1 TaxID=1410327 RepID=UPI000644AD49|nr:hypothetical protein SAMD00019534_084820 [Acytostelium subglobosum LB1]GAM25307.1 hypothetical protein SAMD00019534_084820 [Acytostelium subglobosum LB1]|eukprot:XP_012751827.1 hypothetical protein SAMD00019534_084820 [Acytostelium subglobosum LB1]
MKPDGNGVYETRKFTPNNLRMFCPHVPIQNNSIDCGVYLLHYIELFCKRPETNFMCPLEKPRWFPTSDIKKKRVHIRSLIYQLRKQQFPDAMTEAEEASHNVILTQRPPSYYSGNNSNSSEPLTLSGSSLEIMPSQEADALRRALAESLKPQTNNTNNNNNSSDKQSSDNQSSDSRDNFDGSPQDRDALEVIVEEDEDVDVDEAKGSGPVSGAGPALATTGDDDDDVEEMNDTTDSYASSHVGGDQPSPLLPTQSPPKKNELSDQLNHMEMMMTNHHDHNHNHNGNGNGNGNGKDISSDGSDTETSMFDISIPISDHESFGTGSNSNRKRKFSNSLTVDGDDEASDDTGYTYSPVDRDA